MHFNGLCWQEQQQSKQRQLSTDERQVKSYLTLATETVEMFDYLSADIKQPFLIQVRIPYLSLQILWNYSLEITTFCDVVAHIPLERLSSSVPFS